MNHSDYGLLLCNLYSVRSTLNSSKVMTDAERWLRVSTMIQTALDSANEALEALETIRQPTDGQPLSFAAMQERGRS